MALSEVTVAQWGAFAFGLIIGWYIYYINRYRKGDVSLSDISGLLGAIGGASVAGLIDKSFFPVYGIGLAVGFFGYFFVLIVLVAASDNFNSDWFLDGRRKKPVEPFEIPGDVRTTVAPMQVNPGGLFHGTNPAQVALVFATMAPVPTVQSLPPSYLPQLLTVPKADEIKNACVTRWDSNKENCNYFVRAVAADFSIALDGDADGIVATITGPNWHQESGGAAAAKAAAEGRLVVGGLTSSELGSTNGHVVIVVAGELEHGKYPKAYWTSQNEAIRPKGKEGAGINWSFDKAARDKVHYASIAV
jgi:hypothetical protein